MEPYIPELDFVYPAKPDEHMEAIIKTHEVKVDENYPFLDKSFKFNFVRRLLYLVIFLLVFILSTTRFGLKVEGRKNLRKNKKLLKNGAMTVSNHIHRWDYLFILQAVRYRMMYFPALQDHLGSSDEGVVRLAGGIPIPKSIHLMKNFYQAITEIHAQKNWIHAYPETALFPYFQPIRPFKKGVFTLAYQHKLPVVPLAFSYRNPLFPFTLINKMRSFLGRKKLPMITLRIGKPLMFDYSLSRREAVIKLRKECHDAVVRLAGIYNNPFLAEGD